MKELGQATFEAVYEEEPDRSWWLGENRCSLIAFVCPIPPHNHPVMIRVSETNPISHFGGDKYKNIWKLTKESDGRLSVSPSILQEGCFHCGIPTYFRIIGDTFDKLWPMADTEPLQEDDHVTG